MTSRNVDNRESRLFFGLSWGAASGWRVGGPLKFKLNRSGANPAGFSSPLAVGARWRAEIGSLPGNEAKKSPVRSLWLS